MTSIEQLQLVDRALRGVGIQPVFVGGATIPLYLDAFAAGQARHTIDVDCVVDVRRRVDYDGLLDNLRDAGFVDPIAAWQGRGRNDPYSSHDFEDLVVLLDGCAGLVDSIANMPALERADVAAEATRLAVRRDIGELIEGNLPRPVLAERLARCLKQLDRVAKCAK